MIYSCLLTHHAVPSVYQFRKYIFCVVPVLVLSLFLVRTGIGLNTESYEYSEIEQQTLRYLQITKIEYLIDGNVIENPDKLNLLHQTSRIEVGSQFSRYAIQQSVLSLYALQDYSQIEVSIDTTTQGVALKYELQSVWRVEKIEITGKLSDEFKRKINNTIKISSGDIYTHTIVQHDSNTVKQLCSEFGYFSPKVEPSIDHAAGTVIFDIELGFPSYISEVQILGNSAIFTGSIYELCQIHVGKIYQKRQVNNSVNRIKELYRKKYYPSTKITASFDSQKELLKISIDEGIQLLLDFIDEEGRPIFRESVLLNLLAKIRNRRVVSEKAQLRSKIIQLINDQSYWIQIVDAHFKAKGYHGTEVKVQKLTNSPLHIQFIVKLGTRYIVDKVEFIGNEAFTDSELLREMESKPVKFFSGSFLRRFFF